MKCFCLKGLAQNGLGLLIFGASGCFDRYKIIDSTGGTGLPL
jgi:hypothetical protein